MVDSPESSGPSSDGASIDFEVSVRGERSCRDGTTRSPMGTSDVSPYTENARGRENLLTSHGDNWSDLIPGRDLSATMHYQDSSTLEDYERSPYNYCVQPTKFGRVYSKDRKFIVVSRHGAHVVALPIYTHRGKGCRECPEN